eukprot:349785-Chlamydomonas_euryale.AAC.6
MGATLSGVAVDIGAVTRASVSGVQAAMLFEPASCRWPVAAMSLYCKGCAEQASDPPRSRRLARDFRPTAAPRPRCSTALARSVRRAGQGRCAWAGGSVAFAHSKRVWAPPPVPATRGPSVTLDRLSLPQGRLVCNAQARLLARANPSFWLGSEFRTPPPFPRVAAGAARLPRCSRHARAPGTRLDRALCIPTTGDDALQRSRAARRRAVRCAAAGTGGLRGAVWGLLRHDLEALRGA